MDPLIFDEPVRTESMALAKVGDETRRLRVVRTVDLDDELRSYPRLEQRLESAEDIVFVALDVHLDKLQPAPVLREDNRVPGSHRDGSCRGIGMPVTERRRGVVSAGRPVQRRLASSHSCGDRESRYVAEPVEGEVPCIFANVRAAGSSA